MCPKRDSNSLEMYEFESRSVCLYVIEKMKYLKIYRILSIVAYSVIILKGQMIGLPFLLWLAFTVFDFGNIEQLFAFLAVLGLILIFRNWNKIRTQKILFVDFVCFLLLATPIIGRLNAVPLTMFNYGSFIIPTVTFMLYYLISLAYSYKQYVVFEKECVERKSYGGSKD